MTSRNLTANEITARFFLYHPIYLHQSSFIRQIACNSFGITPNEVKKLWKLLEVSEKLRIFALVINKNRVVCVQ